jgi:hypothetical protein
MKAPLSHFSWAKLAAAALTLATINPSSQAQTSKLIFDSGDEIDTVTFDPAKISAAKLRELMLLSPYIVTYFDQWFHRRFNGRQDFFPTGPRVMHSS